MAQVEYILVHEQKPEDYNPVGDVLTDLKPTKVIVGCNKGNMGVDTSGHRHVEIQLNVYDPIHLFYVVLQRNPPWISFSMRLDVDLQSKCIHISTSNIIDTSHDYRILYKHLKTVTVSEQGGFQYIRQVADVLRMIQTANFRNSDMNAYNDFAVSLRQKSVTPYFSALKALANIYIISSAPDIKNMIHDMERYHGLLKVEDLLEFAACRSDWPAIKRVVMRDMTDCSIM